MDKKTFIHKAWELQAHYRCSDEVRAHLALLDLVAVVGATGAGKTTIMERSGIPYILSDVTRDPRKHEKDGVDYNFRTDYDQLMHELETGQFTQYLISQTGEFYGTKASAYPAQGLCTMALYANALNFFRSLGFRTFVPVYIIPPNYSEWMKRSKANRDNETTKRLQEAKESMELALSDSSYHFMVNDDLLRAIDEFKAIAGGQPIDAAIQERAREVTIELMTKIEV